MSIQTIALILLIGRLISLTLILIVMRKQLRLFRLSSRPWVVQTRWVLFGLTCAIALGNMIPIVIDAATLLSDTGRNNPSTLGVLYGISNCTTAILSAYFVWVLYRMAEKSLERGDDV